MKMFLFDKNQISNEWDVFQRKTKLIIKYIDSVPRPGAYRINASKPEKEEEEGNSSQLLCLKKVIASLTLRILLI